MSTNDKKASLIPFVNNTKSKTNLQTELRKIIDQERAINTAPRIRQLSIPNFVMSSNTNVTSFDSPENYEVPYQMDEKSSEHIANEESESKPQHFDKT